MAGKSNLVGSGGGGDRTGHEHSTDMWLVVPLAVPTVGEFARDHAKVAAGAFAEEKSLGVIGEKSLGVTSPACGLLCFY